LSTPTTKIFSVVYINQQIKKGVGIMKRKTMNKLLAAAGLPLALRVGLPAGAALSAVALNGCRHPLSSAREYAPPEFSAIFYCADGIRPRIAPAYDEVCRTNPHLIRSLTFRDFKQLPIRVEYNASDSENAIKYAPSSRSIQIRGSVGDADFARLLETALDEYLHDPQTHRWDKITSAANEAAPALFAAANQKRRV
jgi:hypothetical protein